VTHESWVTWIIGQFERPVVSSAIIRADSRNIDSRNVYGKQYSTDCLQVGLWNLSFYSHLYRLILTALDGTVAYG
jgi:hypothetical protein